MFASAAPSSGDSSNSNSIRKPSPSSVSTSSQKTSIVQTIERQVFNQTTQSWQHDRWVDASSSSSSSTKETETKPPMQQSPPTGYIFEDDWKIVMTPQVDSRGWNYKSPLVRERTWLRSIIRPAAAASTSIRSQAPRSTRQPTKSTTPTRTLSPLQKVLKPYTKAIRTIKDDFNYKGVGMSFYKSLLNPTSLGMAVKSPLTANFDAWDRRPFLPSMTAAMAVFNNPSPTISFGISTSCRVEALRYVAAWIFVTVKQLVRLFLYQLIRGLFLTFSLLLYPILGSFVALPKLPALVPPQRPQYNAELQERLGTSIAFRYSAHRGCWYWRISTWHGYMPTLLYLFQSTKLFPRPLLDWCSTHFASIGTDIAMPNPIMDTPFFCSMVLSVSGLFLANAYGTVGDKETITASSAVEPQSERITFLDSDDIQLPSEGKKQAAIFDDDDIPSSDDDFPDPPELTAISDDEGEAQNEKDTDIPRAKRKVSTSGGSSLSKGESETSTIKEQKHSTSDDQPQEESLRSKRSFIPPPPPAAKAPTRQSSIVSPRRDSNQE